MSSTTRSARRPIVFVALLVVAAFAVALLAQPAPKPGPEIAAPGGPNGTPNAIDANAGPVAVGNGVLQGKSYKHDKMSKPLRDTPQVGNKPREEDEEEEEQEPRRATEPRNVADGGLKGKAADQAALASPQMPTVNANFDGIPFPGVGCNCAPPDTDGEVGLTQYVQLVNAGLQVWNKSTGVSVLGPITISTIWNGFGGVCQSNGHGDPVVLYDQLANRWLVSQFAGVSVPTDECVAVSTSSDATGTWFRYGFHLGTNFFDYPHLSVWPDGYYMSMNVFNSSGTLFLGPQPFAFDRTAMLAGQAATFVTTGLQPPTDDAMLPADLDGSLLPPAGAPNPFIMSGTLTTQRIYRMHVDFVTPANTAFTLAGTLNPPAFSPPCVTTRACVPQPAGERLDAIGDRPMFRAAYRRFADGHEALVGNQTVCVVNGGNCESPGTAVVSVRWWEIKNLTSGTPTIVQSATYQPDTTHRWMGSAAMDLQGNLALCYSVSSSAVVPGLRCAGRLTADALNTMAQGESVMFAGAGTQTGTSSRWGDYSDLTIDPVDDCTFWYTSEYYPAGNTAFNWRTRIVNFKFPGCTAGPHGTAHFTVTQCGVATPVAGAAVTVDGTNYGVTNASGVLDATLTPGSHPWSVSKNGWSTTTGNVPIVDGQTANVPTCLTSGTAHFVVTNCSSGSPLAGAMVTIDGNVAGQTNSSGVLDVPLTVGQHGWIVTRVNYTQTSGSVNIANATTTPVNTCLTPTCFETTTMSQWFDGVVPPALPPGWSATNQLGAAPLWTTSNSGSLTPVADSAPNSAFVDDPATTADKLLTSAPVSVTASTAQLSFRQRGVFEASWDGGVLEIKVGGGSFTDILAAGGNFTTGGYTGTLNSSPNPLAGRQAWTATIGTTSSFTTVVATLPASAAGQSVQFRWRMGSDSSVAGTGWRIDSVTLNDCVASPPTTPPATTPPPTASPTQVPTASPTQVPTPSPTQVPTPTPTPALTISRLTGSATTCAQFAANTGTTVNGLTYTKQGNKISTVSPSSFRYWVRVNAVAGSNAFTVNQSITSGNFSYLFKLNTGSNVYNTSCATGFSPTFSSTSVNRVTSGSVSVTFTAPTAGTYYISVAYGSSSVRNRTAPLAPGNVSYTFATTGVASSTQNLSLHL